MNDILTICATALWLGILTSISPCPLATNIAAVSYISKKITHPFMVLASGVAYTLGRMASYAVLGWILINSVLSVPQMAQFLQKYMGKALGPILIITGLVLLEKIALEKFVSRMPRLALSERHHNILAEAGVPGAFLLGIIFALAFCPVAAALFFGSLIPMALNSKSGSSLTLLYGIGTGLPVLLFALGIALGVTSLGHWFRRISTLEKYSRQVTGAVFIAAGAYYVGLYILNIF